MKKMLKRLGVVIPSTILTLLMTVGFSTPAFAYVDKTETEEPVQVVEEAEPTEEEKIPFTIAGNGEGWEEGLRREMELDLLNGFTGKTVIHPNQIPVVNEMLRVSQRDYADARAILNWDTGSGSLVSASEDGGRMNEYNTHSRWARRIVLRAERYGVRA